MKRLFCAVKVKPAQQIRDIIYTFREALQDEKINWVSPDNLHLTLKFFGDTPQQKEASITEALHRAAACCPPFSFQVAGCSIFGNTRMPSVLWLGIREAEGLHRLYDCVNEELRPLGYEPDRALYVPHLTIGRIKHLENRHRLNELLAEHEHMKPDQQDVRAFYLFQSILRPQGPEYKILETFEPGEGHRA